MGGVLVTQAASSKIGHVGGHGIGDDIDFTDPETRNRIYAQLRARSDGRPTFMPYRATLYGKIEGQTAVPLFQVNGFSIARATKLGPARWRLDTVEAGYYGDSVTGEPRDRWTNPLNGRAFHRFDGDAVAVQRSGLDARRPDRHDAQPTEDFVR
jgi:hypothetical protein